MAEDAPKGEPEADAKPEGEAAVPKTFTQDDLDRIVSERVARERQKYSNYADLEAKASKLDEIEESQRSEAEKALAKLNKAEERATTAEAKLLRFEVATERKVPADAFDLLSGNSREDLEASADKILSLIKDRDRTPDFDGGARDPAPEPKTPEQANNEFMMALLGTQQQQ